MTVVAIIIREKGTKCSVALINSAVVSLPNTFKTWHNRIQWFS